MLRAKPSDPAAEAGVEGLKGWPPGGGGVASMAAAAVTGTGLEDPGRGWGGSHSGGPEAARGPWASRAPGLRRGLPGAQWRQNAGRIVWGMERGGEKR